MLYAGPHVVAYGAAFINATWVTFTIAFINTDQRNDTKIKLILNSEQQGEAGKLFPLWLFYLFFSTKASSSCTWNDGIYLNVLCVLKWGTMYAFLHQFITSRALDIDWLSMSGHSLQFHHLTCAITQLFSCTITHFFNIFYTWVTDYWQIQGVGPPWTSRTVSVLLGINSILAW